MSNLYYFAYGSNLSPNQIRERLGTPDLQPLFVAYLSGHRLAFPLESMKRWGGGVASFEKAEGKEVWGVVFELTEQQMEKMDEWERDYERVSISVFKKNGEKVEAQTYKAKKTGKVLPSSRYMKTIIGGAMECGLPKEYIEKLKKIRTNGVE